MAICQCMVLAFTHGWENEDFGADDLREGIQYAQDLIEFEGRSLEPFHGYNLRDFIAWARERCQTL